jgi:hypothetical protein
MMKLFRRASGVDDSIKTKLLNRLRKTDDQDLVRWVDNIHTGLGRNVSEMRKSLTREDPSEALAYIDDTRQGAVSLLAAMQVLEERLTRP